MQSIHIAGNVGSVEQDNHNGTAVLKFSIACRNGKDEDATWYQCALWGKRAESLAPHINKGDKLFVSGSLSVKPKENGGAWLNVRVNDIEFGGGAQRQNVGGQSGGGFGGGGNKPANNGGNGWGGGGGQQNAGGGWGSPQGGGGGGWG